MAYVRIACALAILFVAFQFAYSLKCYECLTAEMCGSNSSITNRTCTGSDNLCLSISDSDDKVIMKGCGTDKVCDIYSYCDSCDEDLCNSSPSVTPTFFTVTLVASAIFAKFYL